MPESIVMISSIPKNPNMYGEGNLRLLTLNQSGSHMDSITVMT